MAKLVKKDAEEKIKGCIAVNIMYSFFANAIFLVPIIVLFMATEYDKIDKLNMSNISIMLIICLVINIIALLFQFRLLAHINNYFKEE